MLDQILLLYNGFPEVMVKTNTDFLKKHRNISSYPTVIKILKDIFTNIIISKKIKTRCTRTAEAQISKITYDFNSPIDSGHFHSWTHHKWLTCQILGDKTVKNVQIDPPTTEISFKKLNVREWVWDIYLIIEKLNF